MNTPTPITSAHAALWTKLYNLAHDEIFDVASSDGPATQLIAEGEALAVAALTTERDQLRSDCDNETKWAAHYLAQSIAEKARADKAEAVLLDPQQLHAHCLRNLNEGQIAHLFGERMTAIFNRAARAEAKAFRLTGTIDKTEEMLGGLKQGEGYWDMVRRIVARAERAEADLAAERAIVSRIWTQLGSPTYAQLKGRSIYDLISELKAELATERDLLCACLRDLVDEQNGAPLELRRKQWQAAMDEALAALDATEGAK